ncbi:MAG TPA: valine--tRNA ligase, partial [Chloroflexota bacterium]|nr:valine--tRNA ligase [Chloroflexota bacterium]
FDPSAVEERTYASWLEAGYFKPRWTPGKQPFVMTMPPPNVTGELHIGHALTIAIEDTLVRWHRMMGEPTLWVPGRDHAGIAGQLVVERHLAQQSNLSRHDLGREKFLDQVWEWMNEYGKRIQFQLHRLGTSADWDREGFTMDAGPSKAVRTAFVRLFEKGLIYRGHRITNWCPRCATALSDLEVDHFEEEGMLAFVRYQLVDEPGKPGGSISVATTRPETILADTGIAVHPEDDRYTALIGRRAIVPHVGREIPIVSDDVVDPAFGTGAVKVTPGHDPTDFEIGQRHNLPVLMVMNLDGTMNEQAMELADMPVTDARARFLEILKESGALERVEPHRHAVGHCQRCQTVVEPIVTDQWYVRMDPLAKPALEAVRDGRIRIVPEYFTKEYNNWMENIRDWCISRQLWWGHRIPVWYCQDCGGQTVAIVDPTNCKTCGSSKLEQDPDVLDTWFSSGLWPFSTLGWPDDTEDMERYYPTSVMETGHDILFFWVARMIVMGLECTGQVPFRDVFLHGMVRVDGEKMSKVRGNVQDPVDIIGRYGTDALRLGLVIGTTPGKDVSISESKFDFQRDFVNKMWNIGRFVLGNVPAESRASLPVGSASSLADRWIRSRAAAVVTDVTRLLQEFQLGEASRVAEEFLWEEFASWYIEIAKIQLRSAESDDDKRATLSTLRDVFTICLKLLHPFAPFVTEELWQQLRDGQENLEPSIMISEWPQPSKRDATAEVEFQRVADLIQGIRRLRSEYRVDWSRRAPVTIEALDAPQLFRDQSLAIASLARLDPLEIVDRARDEPSDALTVVAGGVRAFVAASGLFDVAGEVTRITSGIRSTREAVDRKEALLGRQGFVSKAPPAVVERERRDLEQLRSELTLMEEQLNRLQGIARG